MTMWQKLSRYAREGAGSTAKGRTANRNRALYGAALAFGTLLLIVPDLLGGTREGLPADDKLAAITGTLAGGEETNKEIRLRLDGQATEFSYASKAGGFPEVFPALCKGCETTLWVDPARKQRVFQIAVNKRVVRSYADVKSAWMADNSIAPWIAALLAAAGVVLAWIAWRQHRLASVAAN